jgi:hypothetical protein
LHRSHSFSRASASRRRQRDDSASRRRQRNDSASRRWRRNDSASRRWRRNDADTDANADADTRDDVLGMLETSSLIERNRSTRMRIGDRFADLPSGRPHPHSPTMIARVAIGIGLFILSGQEMRFGQKEIPLGELLGKDFQGLKLGEPISWPKVGFGYAYDDIEGYHLVVLIPREGRLEALIAWPKPERAAEIEKKLADLGPGTVVPGRGDMTISLYWDGRILVSRLRTGEINSILIQERRR